MHYDDEIDRERLEQLLGTPDERAAMKCEMDERARALKRDEVLQQCKTREAEWQRPPVVEKTYAMRAKDEAAATRHWQQYIRDQIDSANMALTKAVAQTIVDGERQRDQADFDLRTIIIDVRDRFDEMDARMNELEARISKRTTSTVKCDSTPRHFDRGAFNGWRQ